MDIPVVVNTVHRYVEPHAAKLVANAATTAAVIPATSAAMTLREAVCFILCQVNELC
jgi:hypothetical protein